MKSVKYLSAAIAALVVAAPAFAKPANPPAPVWVDETANISISGGIGSITLGGHSFSFADAGNVSLAYYNDNPGANSQAAIATFIKSSNMLGLTSLTSLTNSVSNDNTGSSSFSITNATPAFNYLAVHIGGGELLFHWSQNITAFSLTGSALSNYRAYAGPTTPVPEPETYAMMIAGLGLVGFVARRRKQQ